MGLQTFVTALLQCMTPSLVNQFPCLRAIAGVGMAIAKIIQKLQQLQELIDLLSGFKKETDIIFRCAH